MQGPFTILPVDPEEFFRRLEDRLDAHRQELLASLREELAIPRRPRPTEEFLPVKEVCTMLRVDERTLRRWRSAGMIPSPLNVGGCLRWRRSDLEKWLESKRAGEEN